MPADILEPPFSIVIPAFNEAKRLPAAIKDLRSFFSTFAPAVEIILVIEKSYDGTLELAEQQVQGDKRFQIVAQTEQRGKGFAVRNGMLRARGEVVFFMDADLSTPLAEVIAFLGHFVDKPEVDVVIGSRAHHKSQIVKKQGWFRRNLGRTFNLFVQAMSIKGIRDTQCGFKAFRRKAAQEIFRRQTLNGFAFDVEVLMLAEKLGYKIDVLPVRWVNSPDSKVRIWIDPLKMLLDLIKIRRIVQKTIRQQPLVPSASGSQSPPSSN